MYKTLNQNVAMTPLVGRTVALKSGAGQHPQEGLEVIIIDKIEGKAVDALIPSKAVAHEEIVITKH